MSKKQDFLRSQQNRDKHPDSMMKGSAAEKTARAAAKGNPADFQQPGTGKLENDHNKQGKKAPTQTNQGQRTPESRHDRQTVNGTMNVTQARTGGKGGGRSTRGGNVGGSG
jgi:hypothetical protein